MIVILVALVLLIVVMMASKHNVSRGIGLAIMLGGVGFTGLLWYVYYSVSNMLPAL